MPQQTIMRLDYETASGVSIKNVGLDLYTRDPEARCLMAAWDFNDSGDIKFWDETMSRKIDPDLKDALRDPNVIKWAFNAQFERTVTERLLKIKTPYESWRCTMVNAYMMGFAGDLATIGKTMGFDASKIKDPLGGKLIQMFTVPRNPTKKDPLRWRDALTNPDEWEQFGQYNRQDVRAESAIARRLSKFSVPESEWEIYALDQLINDTGIRMDAQFVRQAILMSESRKPEIIEKMVRMTGLVNPNSVMQLLDWAKEHGYPFGDMRADSVEKALREAGKHNKMDQVCCDVLQMRRDSSKSSLAKLKVMLRAEKSDGRFRYGLQMCGAQRTGRHAGRDLQPHNMPRTPKLLESDYAQELVRRFIKDGDADGVELYYGEVMNALVGMLRGAMIPSEGHRFVVSDLSSIESVVIGWLTDCKWFMDTLKAGRDLYQSFAAAWLNIPYEETKPHRSKAKPATLGAGYRLGGGDLMPSGMKSGLWGYAENMGVHMSKQEAHDSVNAFRELCPEIVDYWFQLEKAAARCLKTKSSVRCGKVVFHWEKPFLSIELPSGRRLRYFKAAIREVEKEYVNKETGEVRKYKKRQLTYEGRMEGKNKWGMQYSHGGKLVENIVQAIARDVLMEGLKKAHADGFKIVFHVHDEIITEVPEEDQEHNLARLIKHMSAPLKWAPGLPLGAAGWEGYWYRKD